jgi:hypothetical protein
MEPKPQLEAEPNEQTDASLPDMIPLRRSQSLAIIALANDEQRLNREVAELEQGIARRKQDIQQTQAARAELLEEIAKDSGITADAIALNYQFNVSQLVKA